MGAPGGHLCPSPGRGQGRSAAVGAGFQLRQVGPGGAMSGFKMTMNLGGRGRGLGAAGAGGRGAAVSGRKAAAPLSVFQEDLDTKPSILGLTKLAAAATGDSADSLDAFMAGVNDEIAKPVSSEEDYAKKALGSWEELEADDAVASYFEEAEKGGGKKNTKKKEGAAEGDSDASDEEDEEEEEDEEMTHDRRKKAIEPLPTVDHEQMEYAVVKTEFYKPHPEIEALSEEKATELRAEMRITATGFACPRPAVSFAHLALPEELMAGIRKHGYTKPTGIQAQAIPAALSGRDVIGIAETGSGKTVAYLMPMLVHCADQPVLQKDEGPLGIVLCPTRELAIQIEKETYKFNKTLGLRSTTLAGGLSKYQQFKEVKKGSEIVIATPGRIIDIIKMKGCNLRRCTFVVLDEADRMLQMGFEDQMRSVVQNVRPSRQTLLFSATFPPKIELLSSDLLRQPIRITIGTRGQAAENIVQHVEIVPTDEAKWPWLTQRVEGFLKKGQLCIFCKSKQGAEKLAADFKDLLQKEAVTLHGDMGQDERMSVLDSFRKRKVEVLIATDLGQIPNQE